MAGSNTPSTSAAPVQTARETLLRNTVSGVASTSVDGMTVTRQSVADAKTALDELKLAEIKRFPFFVFKWK